jgi:hypothetical protein
MPRLRPLELREEKWDFVYGIEYRDLGLSLHAEAVDSSEMSVHIYESTRHHTPEECRCQYLSKRHKQGVSRKKDGEWLNETHFLSLLRYLSNSSMVHVSIVVGTIQKYRWP